jgi:hypothetical protein
MAVEQRTHERGAPEDIASARNTRPGCLTNRVSAVRDVRCLKCGAKILREGSRYWALWQGKKQRKSAE